MSAVQKPAAELLLAELPDGSTGELVHMADAVQRLAAVMKRRPRDALQALAKRVEKRSLAAFRLQRGGNRYPRPVTAETVWVEAREGRAAGLVFSPSPRTLGGFVSGWNGEASRKPRWVPEVKARAAVVGFEGLAALMRRAGESAAGAATLDPWRLAVSEDHLQGILDELQPTDADALGDAERRPLRFKRRAHATFAEGDGGESLRLVHLVDVAQALGAEQPPARARQNLLQRLGSDSCELFLASDTLEEFAPVVTNATTWRAAMPSGLESWKAYRVEQDIMPVHPSGMDGEEAVLRGLSLDPESDWGRLWVPEEQWKALPALPALTGRAGALEVFNLCSMLGAAQYAPELVTRVHALAMTESDAARLWPELATPRSFWESEPAPVRIAPSRASTITADATPRRAASQQPAQAPTVATQPAAARYSSEEVQTLVDAMAEERSKGDRGAAQRLLKRWPNLLPGHKAPKVQPLKRLLARASKNGIKPTSLGAGAASSVFDLGSRAGQRQKSASKQDKTTTKRR